MMSRMKYSALDAKMPGNFGLLTGAVNALSFAPLHYWNRGNIAANQIEIKASGATKLRSLNPEAVQGKIVICEKLLLSSYSL